MIILVQVDYLMQFRRHTNVQYVAISPYILRKKGHTVVLRDIRHV